MKRFFSIQKILLLGGILFTIAFISACNDDDNNPIQPDVAGLMAFNLAPDQPAIGVALSGNQLNSPLPYMSYTGGYVAIYPGKRSTDAFDANGNTIATMTQTYAAEKYYSLFVIGTDGNYQNIIVNDGLDTLNAQDGNAYIRYINAIPGADQLSVVVKNESDTLITDQASFGSVSAFQPVKASSVTIDIDNGTADTTRDITLENQKAYTILFANKPAENGGSDSIQIRYIENGKLTLDSTSEDLSKTSN